MILGGKEILKQINNSNIYISNFNKTKLNPNSYNLTLNNKLLIYKNKILDCKKKNLAEEIIIPEKGFLLNPGELYLGRTNEYTKTHKYVPMLEGRSSIGRLGLFIHVTAGFGDVGFEGYWTLEIHCVKPIIIYPNMEICQIYYHTIDGNYDEYKLKGKYQKNKDIQPSLLYKDFK